MSRRFSERLDPAAFGRTRDTHGSGGFYSETGFLRESDAVSRKSRSQKSDTSLARLRNAAVTRDGRVEAFNSRSIVLALAVSPQVPQQPAFAQQSQRMADR
jgi:hypothetical protein